MAQVIMTKLFSPSLFYAASALLLGILIGWVLLQRYGLFEYRDILIKKITPIALILIIAIFIVKIILFMFGIVLPF